ncbi:MAG: hypothetical protein Tsb0020_55870 [Haliangiales bacterium]
MAEIEATLIELLGHLDVGDFTRVRKAGSVYRHPALRPHFDREVELFIAQSDDDDASEHAREFAARVRARHR